MTLELHTIPGEQLSGLVSWLKRRGGEQWGWLWAAALSEQTRRENSRPGGPHEKNLNQWDDVTLSAWIGAMLHLRDASSAEGWTGLEDAFAHLHVEMNNERLRRSETTRALDRARVLNEFPPVVFDDEGNPRFDPDCLDDEWTADI